jgi:pimeloyl-ACP methyl ester carboxylesterase
VKNVILIFCAIFAVLTGKRSRIIKKPTVENSGNGYGFPSDFPVLIKSDGYGKGGMLFGFGGDNTLDKNGNRAKITRNPVVLIHGNGIHAEDAEYGWVYWRKYLKEAGYNDSEIWAVSYLGKPYVAQLNNPVRTNINDVRKFIDSVINYLGVKHVDIVGHSLGCNLIRSYLRGLEGTTKDVIINPSLERFNQIGSMVLLAGGNYGMGKSSLSPEFKTGGELMNALNTYNGIWDPSPKGQKSTEKMASDDRWKKTTGTDDNTITYAAVISENDTCDLLQKDTSGLEGADFCRSYQSGKRGLKAHKWVIQNKEVFDDCLQYLNVRKD